MLSEDQVKAPLRDNPHDEAALHVYADWLQERGDPRGELVMLQHRDYLGELTDRDALARYLELTAEHGFLVLPDDPCERILRFRTTLNRPDATEYTLQRGGRVYIVRHDRRQALFQIFVDGVSVVERKGTFAFARPEEINVVFAIISDKILKGHALGPVQFPRYPMLDRHPAYHVGRFPTWPLPSELANTPLARWHLDHRDCGRWLGVWKRFRGA